jgi:hypothetical protein
MGKPGLASVIGHALIDEQFRKILLDDPKGASDLLNAHLDQEEIDFLQEEEVKGHIKRCADGVKAQYIGYKKGAH